MKMMVYIVYSVIVVLVFHLFSYDLRSYYVNYWTETYSRLPSVRREEEEDDGGEKNN